MEIERKYIIDTDNMPPNLHSYPCRHLEQGYLCTNPVVRIRKDNDNYELTYKSIGLMIREEYNLPLTADAYRHMRTKIDGRLITKDRYILPLQQGLNIELDIFLQDLAPLVLAEVEFPDEQTATAFIPPSWFGDEVTFRTQYHNSTLSLL